MGGNQAPGCEGKGIYRQWVGEPPCMCALGPYQCQHHYPGLYIAAPTAMTHPGHGHNLWGKKYCRENSSFNLTIVSSLNLILVKAAFPYTAAMWLPWAILSLHLILHLCLYILPLLHPDRKAKVRKRTRIQVGTTARSSLSQKKKQEYWDRINKKTQVSNRDVLVLDRTDSFCLAASLAGGDLLFACQVAQCSS